jgi:putative Mg2+ transporter-C (MgtC) family protein
MISALMPTTATATAQADALLVIRLVVAAGLAAVAGWDRERAHKQAGLRTHMLVGLAAATFTGLGTIAMGAAQSSEGLRADPVRVIQAVALGIGFLGGGAISASKRQGRARGLTTAASIWATAAVGIAAGLGHYVLAVGATVLQLGILRGVARLEDSARTSARDRDDGPGQRDEPGRPG